jgi:hypothetical protein
VLPWCACKNSSASFDFNKLEIKRYQNVRLASRGHQSAKLRQTVEASPDFIHEALLFEEPARYR